MSTTRLGSFIFISGCLQTSPKSVQSLSRFSNRFPRLLIYYCVEFLSLSTTAAPPPPSLAALIGTFHSIHWLLVRNTGPGVNTVDCNRIVIKSKSCQKSFDRIQPSIDRVIFSWSSAWNATPDRLKYFKRCDWNQVADYIGMGAKPPGEGLPKLQLGV